MREKPKINWLSAAFLAGVVALITYGFCYYGQPDMKVALGVCTAITSLGALAPMTLKYPEGRERSKMNINVVSSTYFFIMLAVDFIFAAWINSIPAYVIISGISVLLFARIVVAIYNKGVN